MSGRPPFPVSIRLTFEQVSRLDHDAGGKSRSEYIKWRLFDPANAPPRNRGKNPVKDHALLAHALALLGKSHVPNNINQLARSANSGSLPFTPETEAAILEAKRYVEEIRNLIVQALNLDPAP